MYLATRTDPAVAEEGPAPGDPPAATGDDHAPVTTNRATIAALGLTSFFTDLASEMVVAILPLYLVTRVGFDVGSYGIFDGALAAASIALVLVGGSLADARHRPKRVALTGYGTSAAARLGLALGVTPVAMLFVDRLGKGLRVAPRDTMIAANAAPDQLATAFATHRALDTAGALAGPLLAFVVLQLVPTDFALIFQLSVLASVTGLVVLAVGVPSTRPPAPAVHAPRARLRDDPCRGAVARVAAAGALVGVVTISDGLLFLALWRQADLAPAVFPLLFAGTALTYLLLAVPVGRLADRVGRARLLVPSLVPILVVYLLLVTWVRPSVLVVACCLALHGLYYALTDGLFSATAAQVVPAELRGRSIGVALFGVAAGKLVGGATFGALWLHLGLRPALGVAIVGLAMAGVVVRALLRPVVRTEMP